MIILTTACELNAKKPLIQLKDSHKSKMLVAKA
jgi:hypothetical protein